MAPPKLTPETSALSKHIGLKREDIEVIAVVRTVHGSGFDLLCRCSCGFVWASKAAPVVCGRTNRCWECAKARTAERMVTHGGARGSYSKRPASYRAWINMKTRCYSRGNISYPLYGGRGIAVCDRWRNSYENFLSDMGDCPDGCSLDRIDNDKNYEPSNCRWATQKEQARNKRHLRYLTVGDSSICMAELADRCGVNPVFVRGCADIGLNGDQIAILAKSALDMLS